MENPYKDKDGPARRALRAYAENVARAHGYEGSLNWTTATSIWDHPAEAPFTLKAYHFGSVSVGERHEKRPGDVYLDGTLIGTFTLPPDLDPAVLARSHPIYQPDPEVGF